MCVVIGNVVVRALCDTGATFTMMSSLLAAREVLENAVTVDLDAWRCARRQI